MPMHPGAPRPQLSRLLAAAALGLSRLLDLRLRDGRQRRRLVLGRLDQAGVGAIVVEEQHLAGDDHRPARGAPVAASVQV